MRTRRGRGCCARAALLLLLLLLLLDVVAEADVADLVGGVEQGPGLVEGAGVVRLGDGGAEEGGDVVVALAMARLRGDAGPAGMVGSAPASRRSCTMARWPWRRRRRGQSRIVADGVDGGLDGGLLEEEGHDVGVVVAAAHEWRPSILVQGRRIGACPHQRLHDRQRAFPAGIVERRLPMVYP